MPMIVETHMQFLVEVDFLVLKVLELGNEKGAQKLSIRTACYQQCLISLALQNFKALEIPL